MAFDRSTARAALTAFWRLLSGHALHVGLILVLLANAYLWIILVGLQRRFNELHGEQVQQRNTARLELDNQQEVLSGRIGELERVVFVDVSQAIEKRQRPITSAETWQRGRDAEFRQRLRGLERARLQIETRLLNVERCLPPGR